MDLLTALFLVVLTIILIMISHLLFQIHTLISIIASNIITPTSPKVIGKKNSKKIYKEDIIVPTSPKVIRKKNSKKI